MFRRDKTAKIICAGKRIAAFCLLILPVTILISCRGEKPGGDQTLSATGSSHALLFSTEERDGYTLLRVQNPWDKDRILHDYILVPKGNSLPEKLPQGTVIRTPVERIVSFSSVICSYLEELGVTSSLVGVAEPEYINNPLIREGLQGGRITNIGQASHPDVEKLLLCEPEAIFANTLQDSGQGQIAKSGIPLIECVEYMENIPLGQAEWIRFFALFFHREERADSIFRLTEKNYNELKDKVISREQRPTVFTEIMYGDNWYQPGGESYMAHLLRDAGADYIWNGDVNRGSVNYSFEQVLERAEKADFWLFKYYAPQEMTYDELASGPRNYTLFDAWKRRKIYTCNTMKVSYYEELPLHPDRMLRDLISIFHPDLVPEHQGYFFFSMAEGPVN